MNPAPATGYILTPVRDAAELDAICALEAASYPRDEAASAATLVYRHTNAPSLFRVLRRLPAGAPRPPLRATALPLLGFACATAAPAGTRSLTHASMSAHDAAGGVACVHSVVVAAGARRRGAGSALVALYTGELRAAGYERALLLSKADLREFYAAAAGFVCAGPSAVQHGADTWYEMRLDLAAAASDTRPARRTALSSTPVNT